MDRPWCENTLPKLQNISMRKEENKNQARAAAHYIMQSAHRMRMLLEALRNPDTDIYFKYENGRRCI
jgi:hypothetical protein